MNAKHFEVFAMDFICGYIFWQTNRIPRSGVDLRGNSEFAHPVTLNVCQKKNELTYSTTFVMMTSQHVVDISTRLGARYAWKYAFDFALDSPQVDVEFT